MTRPLLMLLVVVSTLAGCESLLVEPAAPRTESGLLLTLAESEAPYGDLTPVLGKVTGARFQFIREGHQRDTTVSGKFEGGVFRARVALHLDEALGWLEVRVDLLAGGRTLFSGRSLVDGYRVAPELGVEVLPVASVITTGQDWRVFDALGDTARFEVLPRFATGDPIPGAPIEWSSDRPERLEMIGGGRGVARGNGFVTLTARSLGASFSRPTLVRQVPVSLTGVGPADTTIMVGESFSLRPFGEDANGFPLLPGAGVAWESEGGIHVDEEGVAVGSSPGVAYIHGLLGSVRHTVTVTVVDP